MVTSCTSLTNDAKKSTKIQFPPVKLNVTYADVSLWWPISTKNITPSTHQSICYFKGRVGGAVLRKTILWTVFQWLLYKNKFKTCWQIWVKLDYVFWRKSFLVSPLMSSGCSAWTLGDLRFLMNQFYLLLKKALAADNCTEHIWWRVQTQTPRPTVGRRTTGYPGPRWCMEFNCSRTATTCSLSQLANVSGPIC